MGSWDFYCLLCSAGFYVPWEILQDEFFQNDDDNENGGSEQDAVAHHVRAEKLSNRIQWLTRYRVIGENPGATGIKRCYLSGLAAGGGDYGATDVDPGDDPNAPRERLRQSSDGHNLIYVNVYRNDNDETGVLPIHESCLTILAKAFAHARKMAYHPPVSNISASLPFDLDMLFECLAQKREEYHACLSWDTNLVTDQYFYIPQDHVHFYLDPLSAERSERYLSNVPTIHETKRKEEDVSMRPANRDATDIFGRLPSELILVISNLLREKELLHLILASRTVYNVCKSQSFWFHRLSVDCPWFWERSQIIECVNDLSQIDWHKVYNRVMKEALHAKGPPDEHSGLANRCRIWRTAEQVIDCYVQYVPLEFRKSLEHGTSEFQEQAKCLYCAHVATRKMQGFKSTTTFWLDRNSDLQKPTTFDFYWCKGALCGISVSLSDQKRDCGLLDLFGSETDSLYIRPGDWVDSFILNVSETTVHGSLAVSGITVRKLSGKEVHFGKKEGYKRMLAPVVGNGIVGIKVELAENKVTRIGLLESSSTTFAAKHPIGDITLRQLLWKDKIPSLELRFDKFETGYWLLESHYDLLPMEVLVFGHTEDELTTMVGLSASRDLRWLSIHRSDGSKEEVGSRFSDCQVTIPSPEESGKAGYENVLIEESTKYFPVDGPGGEHIIGFEMTIGALPVGIRIITNRGRQVTFGKRHDNNHVQYAADSGFGVAGIYCSFAYHSLPSSQLSTISLVQSPNFTTEHPDYGALEDSAGTAWEPQPPPLNWQAVGPCYGSNENAEVATTIDFSRSVSRIQGLLPAPEWMDVIELGGFAIYYQDGEILNLGLTTPLWPKIGKRTVGHLKSMPRHFRMATSMSGDKVNGRPHVSTDEEALAQPTEWVLPGSGERLVAVSVWSGKFLNGIQFHTASGNNSPKWGQCGGEPSARISPGGDDGVVALKISLGSRRGGYSACSIAPQAVQAMGET